MQTTDKTLLFFCWKIYCGSTKEFCSASFPIHYAELLVSDVECKRFSFYYYLILAVCAHQCFVMYSLHTLNKASVFQHWSYWNKITITLCESVINQNYFYFNSKWYVTESGLTIGAVISSIFSEFHLQYIEHKCSVDIIWWCHITDYVWYVVDIFIITYGTDSIISYVFREYNIVKMWYWPWNLKLTTVNF